MPLNLAALTTTPGLPGAGEAQYPDTTAACAHAWADAVHAFAQGIVPLSGAVAIAAGALEVALVGAFLAASPTAVVNALEAAFAQFAITVGGGMAGYAPTPPPGLIGFSMLFTPPFPETRQEGVNRVANAIDTWMRTGSATLIGPPAGPVVLWS